MNLKLNNDWKRGTGIFEKYILYCDMEYPSDIQLNILRAIWEHLDSKIDDNGYVYFLEDWHNHDGFIVSEKKIDKGELKLNLHKPEKIFRTRDFYVYDLVYDEKESFMLRWYSENETDEETYCDFSLILSDKKELDSLKKLSKGNI